jgi:uncharacterized tellurite resistance protein B-like protein
LGRKKSSDASVGIVLVIGIIAVIGKFVAENVVPVLIVGGIVVALWIGYRWVSKRDSGRREADVDQAIGSPTKRANAAPSSPASALPGARPPSPRAAAYRVAAERPRALNTNGDEFWVREGGSASVGDGAVGSLLYFGEGLRAVNSDGVEPALINAKLSVSRGIRDCSERRLPYWSSYSEVSAEARAAYLYWLQTARRDPSADIGYVFLYFYGLERRALHDARSSGAAASEIPAIVREVERLLGTYGAQRSFRGYAGAFLDFLAAKAVPTRSYVGAPVDRGGPELTFSHRLALAQCAADGEPLPAAWAHFWVTHDRSVTLGTVPRRCAAEFRQMFEILYRERYGDGMVLPKNRTMLRLEYRPASASLLGAREDLSIEPGLADVSVLSSPVRKLADVAELASEKLGRYSRIVGKDASAAGSFEALVELPIALWPAEYRKQLEAVRDVVARAGRPAAVPFEKFRSWMPSFAELTRGKLRALYVALSGVGLGMEPDVRFGGVVPDVDSRVVLFADDPQTAADQGSPRYLAASLTLHLAAAVAAADGEVAEAERALLVKQMEQWLSLTESERRRLQAHLRLLLLEPPKLTGLKKRIESLDAAAREAVADFLALVAQADDRVTPEEIRQLQKIFRLLGLEPEGVFSKVHAAATEPVSMTPGGSDTGARSGFGIPAPPAPAHTSGMALESRKPGLNLDAAKIAALQKDSERVAAILASVFDAPADAMADVRGAAGVSAVGDTGNSGDAQNAGSAGDARNAGAADDEAAPRSSTTGLLGLDAVHSALLQTLLSRTHWARAELEELAEDRALMLDGALEHLNEACFERFDLALFEDGDPLELNPDAVREVLGVEHQES